MYYHIKVVLDEIAQNSTEDDLVKMVAPMAMNVGLLDKCTGACVWWFMLW